MADVQHSLRERTRRSLVRLRVRLNDAEGTAALLNLPVDPLHWQGSEPGALWLGPDQWLITSDTKPTEDILKHINRKLSGQLYAATDMSSHYVCFALSGPAARTVLAMGCGIDMHASSFMTGQCVRTHFANVLLLIVAVEDNHFDLYLDRSHARYLSGWLVNAGEDPITQIRN